MKKKTYWFMPKTHTGWKKTLPAKTRRARLLRSTPKNYTRYHRYILAGRRIQALANVTKDPATKRKARADAQYFFRKAKTLGR